METFNDKQHWQNITDNIIKGDVLLSMNVKHLISATIGKLTANETTEIHGEKSHAFLYKGNGKVIEASTHGVGICSLKKYLNPTYIVNVYRYPE